MEYKIVMPRLTDTMEVGKIIRWLKKVGDKVERNEPIVEVESDKAVMEVPSFQSGILVKILAEEGDEVPVGEPIAILETEEEKAKETLEKKEETKTTAKEQTEIRQKEEKKEEEPIFPFELELGLEEEKEEKLPEGTASPSARKLAKELGIDIEKLQKEGKLPSPAHEKDIKEYFYSQFFTKTAIELAKEYGVPLEEIYKTFKDKKKIDKKLVQEYIEEKNIPKQEEINSVQKSLIQNLQKSLEIPVYHIFQDIDLSLIKWDENKTLTAWIVKVIGDFMYEGKLLRTIYKDGKFAVYPSANISVAVAVEGRLYAPVIKRVNTLSVEEITKKLKEFKEKAEKGSFSPEELTGGTFAVSNLGMFGIDAFDAIIPPNHVGIVAVGTEKENGKTSFTFSFDHRVINGREGAIIVAELVKKFSDEKYIKSLS